MASNNPEPNEPTLPDPQLQAPSDQEPVNLDTDEQQQDIEDSGAIFQAIGVIVGEVNLNADGKNTITIGRSEYQLFYIPQKRRVFDALTKEIENTGNHTYRLVVYPKVIHFPKKEQPHSIAFQLVGFDTGKEEHTISGELEDLEFKFSGLWQFIPVCPTPCISVFRNFTRERLEYIKQAEPAKKVRFMKSSHLPLLWKDSPVRPFRFNPKADKNQDQGRPVFVSLKAKFLPQRNVFGFVALLALPQETAPKFLKASKKDKATALQASRKDKPTVMPVSKKDNREERSNPPQKPVLKKTSPAVEGEIDK
ncbi:hypothetical protein [Trichormus sp. NMC-1]|uniref:hypothetical protein n=1 Tax=Trichormus sp. NMC-1 TaxID=1853259 RepID=UPI0008DC0816|nr:hypothetical protein [Trichormus sp. NMC-1]